MGAAAVLPFPALTSARNVVGGSSGLLHPMSVPAILTKNERGNGQWSDYFYTQGIPFFFLAFFPEQKQITITFK